MKKKIYSILASAVLCLSMTIPGMAEPADETALGDDTAAVEETETEEQSETETVLEEQTETETISEEQSETERMPQANSRVVTDTWELKHSLVDIRNAFTVSSTPPTCEGEPLSRCIFNNTYGWYYPMDPAGQYTSLHTATIVNWNQDTVTDTNGNTYYCNGIIFPGYFLFRQYINTSEFSGEIIDWADSRGLNWTKDTELKDLTAECGFEIYFTDENGQPADFLAEADQVTAEPALSFISRNTQGAQGRLETGGTSEHEYASDHILCKNTGITYQINGEVQDSLTLNDISYVEMTGESNFTRIWHMNKDYLGTLNVRMQIGFYFHFTVDNQQYDLTLLTPYERQTYEVVRGEAAHSVTRQDSDIQANVNGKGYQTEQDKVTAVQRQDEITYRIDLGSAAEAEAFYQLSLAQYRQKRFADCVYPADVVEKARPYGSLSEIVSHIWYTKWNNQNGTAPRLKADFTLPDHLDFGGTIREITLEQAGGPQWMIDTEKSFAEEKENGETHLHIEVVLSDPGDGPEMNNVWEYLNSLKDMEVSLVIPHVTVSDQAETGTYYTAKAIVKGHMHLAYENYIGLAVKIGAKPSVDEVQAEENGRDPAIIKAFITGVPAAESLSLRYTATSDHTYTAEDYPSDGPVYSIGNDMRDYIPSLDYSWVHGQTMAGKDYIQPEESAAEELWYTVVIPGLCIRKTVTGETAGLEADKEYYFHLTVSDSRLFGETKAATLTTTESDGSKTKKSTDITFNEKGEADFTLKNGQDLLIDMPEGTSYTVAEKRIGETGYNYHVTITDAQGNVKNGSADNQYAVSGTIDMALCNNTQKAITVTFENSKITETETTETTSPTDTASANNRPAPKTGDGASLLFNLVLLSAGIGLLTILLRRKHIH